jgi:hypothetical protein
MIDKALRDAFTRWVEYGIRPGSFGRAVLENDLTGAIFRADAGNLADLPDIVRYVYDTLPDDCWGSSERCMRWEERHRVARVGNEHA